MPTNPCTIPAAFEPFRGLALFSFTEALPAVLMFGGLLLLLWAIRDRLAPRAGPTPRQPDGRDAEAADRLQSVVRDSEELAGLIAAQMDRQAERLERLIADADIRIRKLERLTLEAAQPRPAPRTDDTDPLSARIYDLADQGMPSVEIARQLDQQTGKVELILALRQR